MTSCKIESLQGIRGLAVTFVILFHFFPNQFPNGFLGVDIFFVLSGYFIANILHKNISNGEFLYRRFKRIVPVYLLFILSALSIGLLIYNRSIIESNWESASFALLFAMNFLAQREDKQYEAVLSSAEDFFTHTWSLSVEVQFYILAPLLIGIICKKFRKTGTLVIGFSSLFYYLYVHEAIAFNSLLARLWQFMLGVVVVNFYGITDDDEHCGEALILKEEYSETLEEREILNSYQKTCFYFILFMLMAICLQHGQLPNHFARICTTLASASLVLLCSQRENYLLAQPILSYVGDISYVLYLVHWPVYVYIKHIDRLDVYDKLIAIFVCVILSIAIHETYEKWYLQLDIISVITLIIVLYSVSLFAVLSEHTIIEHLEGEEPIFENLEFNNLTKEQVIFTNIKSSTTDSIFLTHDFCGYSDDKKAPFGDCIVNKTLLNKDSTQSALVIGNSYAANFVSLFVDYCHDKFNDIQMTSISSCETLIETEGTGVDCRGQISRFINRAKEIEPDVLVMYTRHLTMMPIFPLRPDKELLVQDEIDRNLYEYSLYTKKKIIILDALPRPISTVAFKVNNMLIRNITVHNEELADLGDTRIVHSRLMKAVSKCPKCQLVDFTPSFTDTNGTFEYFDSSTGLAYFSVGIHVTPYGLLKLKQVHKQMCSNL